MKTISVHICFSALAAASLHAGTAVEVDSLHLAEDQIASIAVRATPPDGIVAAVFTIAYDTSAINLTGWESPMFPDFSTQFAEAGDEPWFGDSFTDEDGTVYTHPVAVSVKPGTGVRVAALRLAPGTTGEDRLFVLHLRLAEGAGPGFFPISVEPAVLTSAAAGYPADGLAVDPLLSLVPATIDSPDPAYPPVLTAAELPNATAPGILVFASRFNDTTGSGLDDAWEIRFFGGTGLTDATDDFDGDGLPNLLEMFHGGNPTIAGSVPATTARFENGRFILHLPMAPTLLSHVVETTTNLNSGWTEIPPGEIGFTLRPDLGQTSDWTMVELSLPAPPGDRSFFRIRVSAP